MLNGFGFCRFRGRSSSSAGQHEKQLIIEPEILMTKEIESTDNREHAERERDMRQGIDLATTLERIEKNFVISDPRLPDNPIVRSRTEIWFTVVLIGIHQIQILLKNS